MPVLSSQDAIEPEQKSKACTTPLKNDHDIQTMLANWHKIGGPYYLHSDYEIVRILSQADDPRAVHLCNLIMRVAEEGPFVTTTNGFGTENTLTEPQRNVLRMWYIELVNRPIGPQIQALIYRHIARHLL